MKAQLYLPNNLTPCTAPAFPSFPAVRASVHADDRHVVIAFVSPITVSFAAPGFEHLADATTLVRWQTIDCGDREAALAVAVAINTRGGGT